MPHLHRSTLVVSAGGRVWRAAVDLAGVLKNKFEDEIFMMAGPFGIVVGLGVFPVQVDQAAQEIIGGASVPLSSAN